MGKAMLITGGAGFIGSNSALILGRKGWDIAIVDNLSRDGASKNLEWLKRYVSIEFLKIDVRDTKALMDLFANRRFDAVIHLAGQVAVTTSVQEPRLDLESNLLGTFNVLEAIRRHSPPTLLINASTNKVYGSLSHVTVKEGERHYSFVDRPNGVAETEPLELRTPYACSKGAAEQYIIDYSDTYGLRCVNFRQSCIYGPRQFGDKDQGWVAWFMIAHLLKIPITICGSGKQVRDILYIDDLVDAYSAAIANIDAVSGMTFNVGGGPANALSLLELIDCLAELSGRSVEYTLGDTRQGDQLAYVSDIRRAQTLLNWSPTVGVQDGLERIHQWISHNFDDFESLRRAATVFKLI